MRIILKFQPRLWGTWRLIPRCWFYKPGSWWNRLYEIHVGQWTIWFGLTDSRRKEK